MVFAPEPLHRGRSAAARSSSKAGQRCVGRISRRHDEVALCDAGRRLARFRGRADARRVAGGPWTLVRSASGARGRRTSGGPRPTRSFRSPPPRRPLANCWSFLSGQSSPRPPPRTFPRSRRASARRRLRAPPVGVRGSSREGDTRGRRRVRAIAARSTDGKRRGDVRASEASSRDSAPESIFSPHETRSTITSARGTYLDACAFREPVTVHVRLIVERQARLRERACSRKRRDAGGRVRRRRERSRSRRSIRLGRRPARGRTKAVPKARRGPSAYRLRERRGVIVHHRCEREPVSVRSEHTETRVVVRHRAARVRGRATLSEKARIRRSITVIDSVENAIFYKRPTKNAFFRRASSSSLP